MSERRLAEAALRCYPPWWRELYAEEVAQLTADLRADGRSDLRLAANLVTGALSARLSARAMPPRADLWHSRARASIAVATLPFLGALPFVLFGLQANEGYQTLPQSEVLRISQAPGAHVVHQMDTLLHLGVIVGLIAALVGWSALFDGVKWSRILVPTRPRRLLRLPLIFLAVLIGLFFARESQIPHSFMTPGKDPGLIIATGGNPLAATALLDGMWVVLALGVVVSVIAIARVARVCEVPWKTMVSGRRVASFTTMVLSLMTMCAVVGLAYSRPQGFVTRPTGVGHANPHALHTAYLVFPDWALITVVLMIATAASFAGWRASRQASTMLRSIDPRVGITYRGL